MFEPEINSVNLILIHFSMSSQMVQLPMFVLGDIGPNFNLHLCKGLFLLCYAEFTKNQKCHYTVQYLLSISATQRVFA